MSKSNKPNSYGLNIEQRPETTFVQDFMIALKFGKAAVLDTYKRVKKEWLSNPAYWTECVIALNQICWYLWEHNREEESKLFADLYYQGKGDFYDYYDSDSNSDKEAREYYFRLTD